MSEKESDEDLRRKLHKIRRKLMETTALDAETSRRYGVAQDKLTGWLIEFIQSQRDKIKEKSKIGFFFGVLVIIVDLRNHVLLEILSEEQHKSVPKLVLVKKMQEAYKGIMYDVSDFLVKDGATLPNLPSLSSEALYPQDALRELNLCLGQTEAFVLGVLYELV